MLNTLVAILFLNFVDEFIQQTMSMETKYREVLGEIIKIVTPTKNNNLNKDQDQAVDLDREYMLDEYLIKEKDTFTPGFLRHLEGECQRIANAPQETPEGTKMLQVLRLIQVRILEELGEHYLGEGATVLGQLLGYEDPKERLAVLDTGLSVRGVEFAKELKELHCTYEK